MLLDGEFSACVSITDKVFEDSQVVEIKTQVKFSNMYVKSK